MRRIIILALVFILVILSLFGCGNRIDLINENMVMETKDAMVKYNEDDLLNKLMENSELEFYSYICDDYDNDGYLELFAINNDDNYAKIWFVSSDLSTCEEVYHASDEWDNASGEILRNEDINHFVLNEHNNADDLSLYHIFEVKGNKVEIINDGSGYLYPLDDNTIALDDTFSDAMYDQSIQSLTGSTKKTTYLTYDNYEYKEYGAKEIDEASFYELDNSDDIMEAVKKQCAKYDGEVSYQYFKRDNGYYHVQYNINNGGIIYYGYVTIDNHHRLTFYDGKVLESFSGLKLI